ncbi:MAG: IPT/TIG domain-containing protein, partial [Gammaproteobacteria bacterium]|nr:IPT/TIG domain-containing protein [Gammaproteobacteria bacterium]
MAGKSGVLPGTEDGDSSDFVDALKSQIAKDPETGALHLDNTSGELLIFTVQNGEGQFGLPYLLAGRIDLPFPDVYGLDRVDDLALVANGNGGVQAIDISNLNAPYRVGFIKPNGFSRDVKIKDNFAYIAASFEGLVIADIADPAMPIVAVMDTFGVANRIEIVGDLLFVTDMAGDGLVSQLNIVDISDPYHPRLLRTVELQPAEADLVGDGSYDVAIAGNRVYVSVHYSDQEDKPAQSVVEMIELPKLDDPNFDATTPAVIHRKASAGDFAARGMVLARGAMQVAAGKRGVDRLELQTLAVVAHTPVRDERDVSTELPAIELELSAVLAPATPLEDFVRVVEGDPLIGPDVTDKFTIAFGERDGEPARRFIVLTRKDTETLVENTQYFVIVSEGLAPLTGQPLPSDYEFSFATSPAGAAIAPDIVAINPDTGSIQGGTEIVVRGLNFGDQPQLFIGGQQQIVDRVEAPTAEDPFERIIARTFPNNAGPAAVKVTNDAGLSDTVIGGYTYVDILQISFIDPPVVRVSQAGEGDTVRIVGFGFHDGVTLRTFRRDEPENAVVDEVDQDRLSLISSEAMEWVVPDFGDKFRGFVDIEISDDTGRRFLLPNGLFYGALTVDRRIEAELPFTSEEIRALVGGASVFVPDALKLPPGQIVDIASDPDLGVVYVLGKGVLADGVSPANTMSIERFTQFFAPGWISLVRYDRDDVGNAAPMHGLGYFNLPQDLVPTAMHLDERQLYVTATAYDFPFINTEFERQNLLLVYDREDRLPGQGGLEQPPGKDRDVLYALPINFESKPTSVTAAGHLVFVSGPDDGVAVISAADSLRPSVVQFLTHGLAGGQRVRLEPERVQIANNTLH